jgi:hypothetical protein
MRRFAAVAAFFVFVLAGQTALAASFNGNLAVTSPETYKVLAVGPDGRTNIANVGANGYFTVTIRQNSTLHLIDGNGQYAGPIVLARGSRAYAKLKNISTRRLMVTVSNGFATVPFGRSKMYFRRHRSARIAFDRSTGPLGAGNLGFVRIGQDAGLQAAAQARINAVNSIGEDSDEDGLPDIVDVDDDGDLTLDSMDSDTSSQSQFEPETTSTLALDLADSLNANAAGVTEGMIDEALQDNLRIQFFLRRNGATSAVSAINVNCGALPYCSVPDGVATILGPDSATDTTPGMLWTAFDPDSDGLPNLSTAAADSLFAGTLVVLPHVPRTGIMPGDTVLFSYEAGGSVASVPGVIPFYFITTPAVKEYSDGLASGALTYPVTPGSPGTGPSATIDLNSSNLTLTFWRPQRPAISASESGFIDIGKLRYGVYLTPLGTAAVISCFSDDFSALSETLRERGVEGTTNQPLADTANDAPADASSTLSFTLDLDACLTRAGVSTAGLKVGVELIATSEAQDQSVQKIWFGLP